MWQYTGQKRPPFAREPGPGQESVWDYPRPPSLVPDQRHVVVHRGDQVLADTQRSIRVLETASPPTFYLPPEAIDLDALQIVPGSSFCEWKGAARYWALRAQPEQIIGWDYAEPNLAFQDIAGYLAFYPGRIDCFVDGERVQPQAGGFYGGWVTSEIVGPYKGEPGTGSW